jgi:hypothetical protein
MWWAEYPRHKGVSKVEAYKEWKKLSTSDQEACLDGVISYAEQCRKEETPEHFIVHPVRFIRHRRWETLVEAAQ